MRHEVGLHHDVGLASIAEQIREASANISKADSASKHRIEAIEQSVNELYKRQQRPGAFNDGDDDFVRKEAIDYCKARRALTQPRVEGNVEVDYEPSHSEINEATLANKALRTLFRTGDLSGLDNMERKSLSAFTFGTNNFLLAPQMSNQVLSCLVDPTDVSGLVNSISISAGSIQIPIDNTRFETAGWACDTTCWHNNAPQDPTGFSHIEIKVEPLRYVACATRDLLADALFDVQAWLLRQVTNAFCRDINNAIILGDGIGKPVGIMHPSAGVQICDTSPSTPTGQFSWQDLLMLASEVPVQWQRNGRFLMNSRTFALLMTMSDASGRPLLMPNLQTQPGATLFGYPIVIVSQLPDVVGGSTPIFFGDWNAAYLLVRRSGPTMTIDNVTSFCSFYLFEQRIGGAPLCSNAVRGLRIR